MIARSLHDLPFISASGKRNGLRVGLTAYLKLDETGSPTTYADATGNGWTGTKNNGVVPATGKINGGQNMTPGGSTGGITISSSIDTRISSAPLSVSFWLNTSGLTGSGEAVIGEWNTRNDWVLFDTSGDSAQVTLRTSDDTGTTTDSSSIAFTLSTFNHFVITWDGTNSKVYLNGALQSTRSPANIRRGGGAFVIGNYQTLTFGAGGIFDEVGYWSVALTATQVLALYNSNSGLPFSLFTF